LSEDKLGRDIVRAGKAKALLENELFSEAFAKLEADYIAAWRVTPARDTDARERLWQAVNVVGIVKEHFARVVSEGNMAQIQINQLIERENNNGRK
jgi:hypothetical protein